MKEKDAKLLHETQFRADALIEKRQQWEEGSYKKSNEELYDLLNDCLQFYRDTYGKRSRVRALNNYLSAMEITFTNGTSLATKIARAVFDKNLGKRAYSYAKVIDVAFNEMKEDENLADFITRKGGVEEVRRASKKGRSPDEIRKDRIKFAKSVFGSSKPITQSFKVEHSSREIDPGADSDLFVAVMRQEPNGSYSMVYETGSSSALNKALEVAGSDEKLKDLAQNAEEDRRESARENAENAERLAGGKPLDETGEEAAA